MKIRASSPDDVAAITTVFFESVHKIAARSYTAEQREAWAPKSPDLEQWRSRLAGLETLVTEVGGEIGGFISYAANGHIEFLYTAPAFSRRGVASKLYRAAVGALYSSGVTHLSTEASIEARPFFQAMGFSVVEEQVVERDGVQLRRFAMSKVISGADAEQDGSAAVRHPPG